MGCHNQGSVIHQCLRHVINIEISMCVCVCVYVCVDKDFHCSCRYIYIVEMLWNSIGNA